MVQVGVVVHHGSEALPNLTKDNFQVFDNGKEQPIAAISGGVIHTAGEANPNAAKGAVAVFSNRVEKAAPGLTVVLLDALNTPPNELTNAKSQVVRCLEQLEGNNSIALYALNGKLLVLHDFTENTGHLKEVLAKYRSGLPVFDLDPSRSGLSDNPATAGTPLGRMARDANTELSALYARERVQMTIAAIKAIAIHLRTIPGRKNLIWISASFPVSIGHVGGNRDNLREETRSVGQLLTDADVAVYPVHTAGLAVVRSADTNARAPRRAGANTGGPVLPESMQMLADKTGGKAFFGTNDLGAAVAKALSDSEGSYTIGFYPPEETLDGKFHELKVRVNVRGVEVRARRGYFATPELTLTPEQRQARLNEAVASPFEATGIQMKVRLDSAGEANPGKLRLIVGIDLSGLSLASHGDHRVGGVEMMLVQRSDDGRRLQSSDEDIKLDLPPDEFKRMSTDGLVLVKYVEPAAGLYQLRVYLLDANSGTLGSVYAAVTP